MLIGITLGRRSIGVALILLSIAHLSCGNRPTLLTGGGGSAEELVQLALDRLAANDTDALDALTITRFEHDSLLIPEMPIGKAPKELTDLNMAYVMMRRTNMKGLRRAIADYGGNQYDLVKVEFPKPIERYGPFTVYRETVATVHDTTGAEFVLPIFGSMVAAEGRFKLAAFID
jgi:hypothetical protein